jgi:hypothetical protein
MGWPLAVAAGLMERSSRALVAALWPLSIGHLLAMLLVLFPFALLVTLVEWQRQIQIGASLLVIGFGIFRFVDQRHPRVLARIRPTQLGLWSFAVAIAHGAGLMLVPIYLGLCQASDVETGHEAAGALINANLGNGRPGVRCPFCRDDDGWRIIRVVGLPLPGPQVRVAELVQSGCDLGHQPRSGGRSLACDHPCERALSRISVGSVKILTPGTVSRSATTASTEASTKPRGTFVDAALAPNERGKGFTMRFVFATVTEHARPLRSCSLVDFLTISGAQDHSGKRFVSSWQV